MEKRYRWRLKQREILLGERTLIMGVLNVTPDSFSDGDSYSDPDRAFARALELEDEGADIIDIGAESTRPGHTPISAEEELARIEPGFCEIRLPCRPELTQQHGFVHGGIVSMIADSAGGYAAFTLFAADASILTVEYKLNLLAPSKGETLIARAEVLKSGRTLTVAKADVYAVEDGAETHCAVMQQTLITLHGKEDKS